MCVPVKYRRSRHKSTKCKILQEPTSSSVAQSPYCCLRGRRLRIEHEKLATHHVDRRRISVGSGQGLSWLPEKSKARSRATAIADAVEADREEIVETERQEIAKADVEEKTETSNRETLKMGWLDSGSDKENTYSTTTTFSAVRFGWLPVESAPSIIVRPAPIPVRSSSAVEISDRQCLFPPLVIPGPGDLPPFDDVELTPSVENIRMTGAPMTMPPARALAGILKIAKTKAILQGLLVPSMLTFEVESSHYPLNVFTQLPGDVAAVAAHSYSVRSTRFYSSKSDMFSQVSCTAASLSQFLIDSVRSGK